jgi:hypothetical protein
VHRPTARLDRHSHRHTWTKRSTAQNQVDAMNTTADIATAYLIDDQSINDNTTAAIGESVIHELRDPAAQQHENERVLRPNFYPTIGRHRRNAPATTTGTRGGVARFATGPSFSVGRRHRTRQRQLDCPATTKGRQGEKAPALCLTRAFTNLPYPLRDKMGGGGPAHGF